MKRFVTACLLSILTLVTGCVGSSFQTVEPPVPNYPQPTEYVEAEVYRGTLKIECHMDGWKEGNSFVNNARASAITSFQVGDRGIVEYSVRGTKVSVAGVLTECPPDGIGRFVVSHEALSTVSNNTTGRFTVTSKTKENCVLVPRSAVTLLTNDGEAVVYLLTEAGTLSDRIITVGDSNDDVYEVLSGLSAGEKVVRIR